MKTAIKQLSEMSANVNGNKEPQRKAALISVENCYRRNEIVPIVLNKAAGLTGINWDSRRQSWRVRDTAWAECGFKKIGQSYRIHIGYFKELKDAIRA